MKADVEKRLKEIQENGVSNSEIEWLGRQENGAVNDIQTDEALQLVKNYIA